MRKHSTPFAALLFATACFACDFPHPVVPAEPSLRVSPEVYVPRIKNLLVGLPASAEEVKQGGKELAPWVDTWMHTSAYSAKMLRFFSSAFQQSEVQSEDLIQQAAGSDPVATCHGPGALLLENIRESFGRTALALAAEGAPFTETARTTRFRMTLPLMMFYAVLDAMHVDDTGNAAATCSSSYGQFRDLIDSPQSPVSREDFTRWRWVTIRKPQPGEATANFCDVGSLRDTTELVLNIPRVGFFTTPAFLAQWGTNASNQARVTINQTLIVGLGHAFDGTKSIAPVSEEALDSPHAPPHTACYACHQTLDPMRQFFRHDYTLYFHEQNDPHQTQLPGMFAFDGVSLAGETIYDLGNALAAHPDFAEAWVQKLCTYANAAPCDTQDPDFVALVDQFVKSGYTWDALVRALFASPIVTQNDTFPVTKEEHLCVQLSERLRVDDVCSLPELQPIMRAWPSDAYSRGAIEPVMANRPTLFYRAGLENICIALSERVVGEGALFDPRDVQAAVGHMVHDFMGLATARAETPMWILRRHYNEALESGVDSTTALQSTFVLACTSPAVAGLGQ